MNQIPRLAIAFHTLLNNTLMALRPAGLSKEARDLLEPCCIRSGTSSSTIWEHLGLHDLRPHL